MKSDIIGILGGGQLGKMLAQAASPWDLHLRILDPTPQAPAAHLCQEFVLGDFRDKETVLNFGRDCDVLTIEIEQVNVEALEELEKEGKRVVPSPAALRIIQDKGLQKQHFEAHGLPSPAFALYDGPEALQQAVAEGKRSIPFVQKVRTEGYDGRGVHVVRNKDDLNRLLPGPCLAEDAVSIDKELAVIAARNPSGQIVCFPPVEMTFHPTANLVEFLLCPARISEAIAKEAETLARQAMQSFPTSGLLAVELFLDTEGNILINEVAPRPHNSGHHTIEGCMTSQYQQLLRCLLDLPLGSTTVRSPAVMMNLLGEPNAEGPAIYDGADDALDIAGAFIHLYGKFKTRPFRKMGHVTVLDADLDQAIVKARKIQTLLKVTA